VDWVIERLDINVRVDPAGEESFAQLFEAHMRRWSEAQQLRQRLACASERERLLFGAEEE
jgi:hypothetical protein